MKRKKILISFGSSHSDGQNIIKASLSDIERKIHVEKISEIIKTKSFGNSSVPFFYNMVAIINYPFKPFKLLRYFQKVESKYNKQYKKDFWGERNLDIDIISIEGFEICCPYLTIPHEGIYQREYLKKLMSMIGWEYEKTNITA